MEILANGKWIIFDDKKLRDVMIEEERIEFKNIISKIGKEISYEETERCYNYVKMLVNKYNVVYRIVEDD